MSSLFKSQTKTHAHFVLVQSFRMFRFVLFETFGMFRMHAKNTAATSIRMAKIVSMNLLLTVNQKNQSRKLFIGSR